MADYLISCESTADMPRKFFEQRNIGYVCFHYEMDGKTYTDDLYQSTTPQEFFGKLKAGSQAKTSQVGTGEYVDFWEPYLKQGLDILHVSLSSGISGTYNSACLAAETLAPKYPERKIRVIDSLAASAGFGLLVEYMADKRDAGMGFDDLVEWTEGHKLNVNHWFFVSDLDCLKRGGRVSATSALIATALKICPVMNVDYEGKLIPREKIRTKKKAIVRVVDNMMDHVEDGAAYTGRCAISHSDCLEDALAVADLIGERIPALKDKVEISDIGTVIGAHTGPGTVALFFMGDERVD
ncbi:DegV family protein [Collinsella tanakaei]|uniref:DegV family protein n=1 Tax=Collinsella tanakaei TaxID=626935 RepID=UPI00195A2089|nr:DegV family protein [Collinsella tanakaei]MBM6755298.1 DegV family protein [Collinsella tanakaei]MBM6867281.1 DegV family protein [Collinsella tanakaei]